MRVVDVDEAVSRTGDVVGPAGVLLRVGDVEIAVDRGDTEGSEARGDLLVGEGTRDVDRVEVRVEDVDGAGVEVGREEEGPRGVETNCEPLVHRMRGRVVYGDHGRGWLHAARPAR